ncbi:MAG: endolytic transglycosylase MltG [Crocinitomicaceae bacterium]
MRYKHSYKKRKTNKSGKLIFTIFVCITLFFIFGKSSNPNSTVTITVPKGASVNTIASLLKDNDIIDSEIIFKTYLKSQNAENTLLAGTFSLKQGDKLETIVKTLQTYQSDTYKITIPEGLKTKEIELLASNQCLNNCEFIHPVFKIDSLRNLNNYEGLLFPDTYYLDKNSSNKTQLLKAMLDNFIEKLPSDYESKLKKLPKKDLYSTIIVASLIEKEVRSDRDKKLVSGIIWKRFENDWSLGIDAALLYLKNNNQITYDDLQANNPYNLRKFKGLPPTPICNPGLASIQAALNPEYSEYWFYLSKSSNGETVFAKTNAEHNNNKTKYL